VYFRAIAAMLAAATVFASSASAAESDGPPTGGSACVGLTCPQSDGGLPASVQSRWMATSVSGPEALQQQKVAGFYEFGKGTTAGGTAIAYVAPHGTIQSAPSFIRDLQVVRDIPASDYESGTVVIFDSGAAGYFPTAITNVNSGTPPSRTLLRAIRRPSARIAVQDEWGCEDQYFCIYGGDSWGGGRYQWHDINSGSNWVNLGDYGINDWANSSRDRRDRDSWLAENSGGTGDRHCYDSHSSDANFGGWSNDASSTYNSEGDSGC
jgi:hypothetical protein